MLEPSKSVTGSPSSTRPLAFSVKPGRPMVMYRFSGLAICHLEPESAEHCRGNLEGW